MTTCGPGKDRDGGFTLVELTVVLIVVGILAAVAIPRFANLSSFNVREGSDQALALVRYGQKMAIGQNQPVYVLLSNSSIGLCYDAACNSPVAACNNSKSWECEALPSGVTLSATNGSGTSFVGSSANFYFSPQGKPYKTGETESAATTFISQLTITLTSGTQSYSFYLEQETGYVHR